MTVKRFALPVALALLGLLGAGVRADAAYTYSTSIVVTSVNGGTTGFTNVPGVGATITTPSGTVVTLGDIPSTSSFVVGGTLSASFATVGVTTTSLTPDSFTVNYRLSGVLTNPTPGGATASAFTTGVLTFSNIQTDGAGAFGGNVTNQYLGPLSAGPANVGGALFTLNLGNGSLNQFFGPPTIGSPTGTGNLGGLIISTSAVPEPASVVMMGLGVAGVAGLALRRRRA